MNLGILITQSDYADMIIEITKAAVKRGYSISIFMTDNGVKLIKNPEVANLRRLENVGMSLCDFSAKNRGIDEEDIPEGITAGTQYQNSLIHNECDKVLIF